MKRPQGLAFTIVLSMAALACSTAGAQAADLIITAERLLDVRTGRMVQRPEILVRDGKVVSVKPDAGAPVLGETATRLALPGMTVLGATGA